MTIRKEIEEYEFGKGIIGSLLDLCCKVKKQEDAKLLLERYRAINQYADQNLGYIFGYCGAETRQRLYSLFPVNHPIFGSGFGRGNEPTPTEAFNKGVEMAEKELEEK